MSWLARLKKQKSPDTFPTETMKRVFEEGKGVSVVSIGCPPGCLEKINVPNGAANDDPDSPVPADPDRFAWPHGPVMNRGELDLMVQRLALFDGRGLTVSEAEILADKLVLRDREGDRRGACAECKRLSGHRAGRWQCYDCTPGNELAGMPLARVWLTSLHACHGFVNTTTHKETTHACD